MVGYTKKHLEYKYTISIWLYYDCKYIKK